MRDECSEQVRIAFTIAYVRTLNFLKICNGSLKSIKKKQHKTRVKALVDFPDYQIPVTLLYSIGTGNAIAKFYSFPGISIHIGE